jgi:hypothetical protein
MLPGSRQMTGAAETVLLLLDFCATAGWQTQKLKAASSRTTGVKFFTKRIENPPQIKLYAQRQGETNAYAAFSFN